MLTIWVVVDLSSLSLWYSASFARFDLSLSSFFSLLNCSLSFCYSIYCCMCAISMISPNDFRSFYIVHNKIFFWNNTIITKRRLTRAYIYLVDLSCSWNKNNVYRVLFASSFFCRHGIVNSYANCCWLFWHRMSFESFSQYALALAMWLLVSCFVSIIIFAV